MNSISSLKNSSHETYSPHTLSCDLINSLQTLPKNLSRELFFMYQGKISLITNEIIGYEALLRWDHPKHGRISPLVILDLVEGAGRTQDLARWTMHQISLDMQSYPLPRGSLNLCPNLLTMDFAHEIVEILKTYSIDPSRLMIELTEHNPPENWTDLARAVNFLRNQGIIIALDDFGTGFANINYLSKIDLDYIKMDRSLVSGIAESCVMRQEFLMLMDIISVTGAKIIAEGIENEDDAAFLKNLGVEEAQGYLFHMPVKVSELFL